MNYADPTSAKRVARALAHEEPDRVPVDLGATGRTGFRVEAQDRLLRHFEIDAITEETVNPIERIALPHEALTERYPHDFAASLWQEGQIVEDDEGGEEPVAWSVMQSFDEGDVPEDVEPIGIETAQDAYGVTWVRRGDAPTFSAATAPLGGDTSLARIASHGLPEPDDERRWSIASGGDLALTVGGFGRGLIETARLLRGPTAVLRDLSTGGGMTEVLLDRLVELKCAYWESRLAGGDIPDGPSTLLLETERLDLIEGLPMDARLFRSRILSKWTRVLSVIRRLRPASSVFFFCPVYEHRILPDLIDAGVRCVNLPSGSGLGAKPGVLKREYGDELTFWGGTASSAGDFLQGSDEDAADDVKEALDTFAPGGGFVWSLWPVVEASVPARNVVRALDTLLDYGLYY